LSYSINFYNNQKKGSLFSARELISLPIINVINPSSVIDFGCGTGSWLSEFKKQGTEVVLGIDGEFALPSFILNKKYFKSVNFESSYNIKESFDLAICLEVLEHLSESAGNYLIDTMTECSDVLLISAAVPYQGGTGHINENWLEYWSQKFKNKGYTCYDIIRPLIWDNNNVEWWYRQNLVLYIRKSHICYYNKLSEFHSFEGKSLIHPINYINTVHKDKPKSIFKRNPHKDIKHYTQVLKAEEYIENPGYGHEYEYDPSFKRTELVDESDKYGHINTDHLFYLLQLGNEFLKKNMVKMKANQVSQNLISIDNKKLPDILIICNNLEISRRIFDQLKKNTSFWTPPVFGFDVLLKQQEPEWYKLRSLELRNKALEKIRDHLENNNPDSTSSRWVQLLCHISAAKSSEDWVKEIFSFGSDEQIKVELSHLYSFLSIEYIQQLLETNPDLKVILIEDDRMTDSNYLRAELDKINQSHRINDSLNDIIELINHKHSFPLWKNIFSNSSVHIKLSESDNNVDINLSMLFDKKRSKEKMNLKLELNLNTN